MYLQSCVTITTDGFRSFPLTLKETLYPLAATPSFPLPLPSQATTYLLSVYVNLPILEISHKWNNTVC